MYSSGDRVCGLPTHVEHSGGQLRSQIVVLPSWGLFGGVHEKPAAPGLLFDKINSRLGGDQPWEWVDLTLGAGMTQTWDMF